MRRRGRKKSFHLRRLYHAFDSSSQNRDHNEGDQKEIAPNHNQVGVIHGEQRPLLVDEIVEDRDIPFRFGPRLEIRPDRFMVVDGAPLPNCPEKGGPNPATKGPNKMENARRIGELVERDVFHAHRNERRDIEGKTHSKNKTAKKEVLD